jgi:ribose 5-phosphate isomerase A
VSDDAKRDAARRAAQLVEDGMTVGLGTGSTVAHLLPALAERGLRDLRCVATSVATEEQARGLGLPVEPFDELTRLDLAIDGADEVSPDRWLVKGGGGAHTREKIVAVAAKRFVVIVDPAKAVEALTWPVPLELLPYGLAATLEHLQAYGATTVREGAPPSPDGGVIADHATDLSDPRAVAQRLAATPGVVDHGLFPPELVADVIVGEAR